MRMRKCTLRALIDVLVNNYGLPGGSRNIPVEESMAIFLLIVGQGLTYPMVEERLQHSSETISTHFHRVLDAVCLLGGTTIVPQQDTFANTSERIRSDQKFYPHFVGAIGAIDGTHILVHVPDPVKVRWVNRKGVTTTNVLGVCDFNIWFIYVNVEMEGSMHDARVLTESISNQRYTFPIPPEGKYYLADSAYQLTTGFLTTYRNVRYHRSEYGGDRRVRNAKELFNTRHSSLRNVIERAFGILKRRWRILNNMSVVQLETQFKIIWSCVTLHNFIREIDAADHADLEDNMPDNDQSPDQIEIEKEGADEQIGPSQMSSRERQIYMEGVRTFITNSLKEARGRGF